MCTKHDRTSAQCIFNWNTYVSGHKQGTVGFPQRPLPRSPGNFSVSICTSRPCIILSYSSSQRINCCRSYSFYQIMGLRLSLSFMMYTKLPTLIIRVCCRASCLCVVSNLSYSSLLVRSMSVILHKQSVCPFPRIWFISLSVSVSRQSS